MNHFRLRFAYVGGHVHVSVWVAPTDDATHTRAGQLIFRPQEWEDFRDLLRGVEILEGGEPA